MFLIVSSESNETTIFYLLHFHLLYSVHVQNQFTQSILMMKIIQVFTTKEIN